ncbi:nuclear transport factor 2 family protein [Dyella mobilis]|uniref:Nuclear transport factor 2 family protein n=1 Tax=Dyella mobilis TaxID=1849582 RepID=A0ABS2KDN6_9GAMM|nr:nuclear transport factor 2 family protein [Dyella mobilis]MBM7128965.1 nuclear transport factor 2 family protein [Dyella mobilis]GLQ99343.1 hypothetical protein GCM10007863_37630 [Dyella mobilis]
MKFKAIFLTACTTFCATGVACAQSPSSADAAVAQTVSAFLSALSQGNEGTLHKLTCQGFYAFDAGSRFSGDDLFALVKKYQAAGSAFSWSVTMPEVHVTGKSAWITYVNQGSIKNAAGTKSMHWLESAQLQNNGDGWCINFLHSTPVSAK